MLNRNISAEYSLNDYKFRSASYAKISARGFGVGDMSVLGDALFALGMLLAIASQLRIGDLPIGPGELCLAIWLVLTSAREAKRFGPPVTRALSRLLIFWGIFVIFQCVGFLNGLFIGEEYDQQWLIHDAVAYPLVIVASCLSVVEPRAKSRLRRVAWLMVTFAIPILGLQVMGGWGLIDIAQIQPWYWERFRGWSDNPNQLSLLCGVLGLISLHLADTATRPGSWILAIVCSILPISVGLMTKSDTFALALVASGPIFIVSKLLQCLFVSARESMARFAFACIVVITLPFLFASLVPLGMVYASSIGMFAKGLTKNGGAEFKQESDLRFALWSRAIQRGIETSMLGLGPGPHIEIPPEILGARMMESEPGNLVHPLQSSAANFEAHNSFLDLFTQGGIIILVDFIWILSLSALLAYKARRAGLITLICGLVIFCMTGNVVRHPLFWFSVALCLVESDGPRSILQYRGTSGQVSASY
jgi:hypothetical protein